MRNINIPGLSDIPVVGELLFSYNLFVYLGVAIALILGYYLHKTKVGLNVQAIGENPAAADAAGIPVTKLRYLNILLAGGICGIGGAYCSMIINGGVCGSATTWAAWDGSPWRLLSSRPGNR